MKNYLPLRIRTSFSKGGISLRELFSTMKGFSYIPIADIDGIWGWGSIQKECLNQSSGQKRIKPLFGTEISIEDEKFLLFVKEKKGYYNLCKILNRKELDGDGIVKIYIPKSIQMKFIFENFDDFYIGITLGNIKWLEEFKKMGYPLVWANPVNYFNQETLYKLVLSIREGIPFPIIKGKRFSHLSLLPMNPMESLTRDEGIFKRTWEIAEKCQFELNNILPKIHGKEKELRELVEKIATEKNLNHLYIERMEKELRVIEDSGFSWLFLLSYEIKNFAKTNGILYNLRGSGASSLIAYILEISHIDPVKNNLYFERFLNSGREEPPDLDIDFESQRRDEVIEHLLKEHSGKVSFIASFKDFKARSALYFTCKALGFSSSECREIAKKVPAFSEPSLLKKILCPPGWEKVWRLASLLDGIHFQKSLHVGGLVFTPYPVTSFLPLQTSKKGYPVTHFDREGLEEAKMVKIDLLGVRGLSAISMSMRNLNLERIPEDDSETFDLIGKGETIGCFQIESPAMIDLLRKIKPKTLSEIADALALVRPGPTESGMKRGMIMIRNGKNFEVNSFLKNLLPESNGLIIYEEQIMEIAHKLGFEWEEAEILRKNLKKGKDEEVKKEFVKKGSEKGWKREEMEEIWRILKYFSSYTFNKAHAYSYAWSAYISCYLKTHRPLQFFSSLINSNGGYYPLWEYMEEARRRNIKILPPDVNKSEENVKIEGNSLRKGLVFIKGLRKETIKNIVRERKSKSFLSLYDFMIRINPKKEEMLSLIKSGALDSLAPFSLQISLYLLNRIENIKILKDSREKDFSLERALKKISDKESPYKIKDLNELEGRRISLPVRIVDARTKIANGKRTVFYILEDETGIIEATSQRWEFPETRLSIVSGRVMVKDGVAKLFDCEFKNPDTQKTS